MEICARWTEEKLQHLVEEEDREGAETAFQTYGRPLASVSPFKYLERVLTASGDDWMEVFDKMRNAQCKWAWMSRILVWEGTNARTSGTFYKAVVKAMLFLAQRRE